MIIFDYNCHEQKAAGDNFTRENYLNSCFHATKNMKIFHRPSEVILDRTPELRHLAVRIHERQSNFAIYE